MSVEVPTRAFRSRLGTRLVLLALAGFAHVASGMSIHVMSEVWSRSRARGTALLVLLAFADSADRDTRLAWPSNERLTKMTRAGLRSVQRAKRELEELGELELVEPGRPGRNARYRVRQIGTPADDARDAEERQPCRADATQVAPNPSIDPFREPKGEGAREPTPSHPDLDAVLEILDECPRFDVERPGVRVGVESALALYPNASPIEAARTAVVWASDPDWRKTSPAATLLDALAHQKAANSKEAAARPRRGASVVPFSKAERKALEIEKWAQEAEQGEGGA